MPTAWQYATQDLVGEGRSLANVATVRAWSVFLFRAAQLAARIHPFAGFAIKQLNHVLTGADVAWQAEVGPGLQLLHPQGVVIGPHVAIGRDCRIQQGVTVGNRNGLWPTIGDRVNLGAGCRIIGEIRIGDDVQVGANAVVLKDVPDGATAVGVPARVIVP